MSEKKMLCFRELIKFGPVRIPKIQRDYAQGRRNPKVDEIRKSFVHSLMLVVKGKRPGVELDFVYGSDCDGAFEPLDGQQRLTTLFLLHWMLGASRLASDEHHSKFTYETRATSKEFCDELVQHDAMQFIREATANAALRTSSNVSLGTSSNAITPSAVIRGRDWFKWEWRHDPTILSMLVMIDAIYVEMGEDWNRVDELRGNLDHITFNLLDMDDFGLSDELFVKMNARGKQLSDFDKLKSTLEEELQLQQKEVRSRDGKVMATPEMETDWRSRMDGQWINFFWEKYAKGQMAVPLAPGASETEVKKFKASRLTAAKRCELQFKKLILRLMAIQLLENENTPEALRAAAYKMDEKELDGLLSAYNDSLMAWRSEENRVVNENVVLLNFARLAGDVNAVIYSCADGYMDVSGLLPESSRIYSDVEKNQQTLLDSFLGEKLPYDVAAVFYAMLLFLREFPMQRSDGDLGFDASAHKEWLANLEQWVRSLRTVLINSSHYQRIDNTGYLEAVKGLNSLVGNLKEFVTRDSCLSGVSGSSGFGMESDGRVVTKFLSSLNGTSYTGLDNRSFAEEVTKAGLRLEDDEWNHLLGTAEEHLYLWGQVRCLLDWSSMSEERNVFKNVSKDFFVAYSERLRAVLDFIGKQPLRFYTAALVLEPYYWENSNCLYRYDRDRDYSFKAYLRARPKDGGSCGKIIKKMIDTWKREYADLSASEFMEKYIEDKSAGAPQWVKCIVEFPDILDWASQKMVYQDGGHVILAQLKTEYSHCYDPVLIYLWAYCEKVKAEVEDGTDSGVAGGSVPSGFKFCDSKADNTPHTFEWTLGDHKYMARWHDPNSSAPAEISASDDTSASAAVTGSAEGLYDLLIDGEDTASATGLTASNLITKFHELLVLHDSATLVQ
jgi:hypothetical protein